jgi:hypothetical protein
MKGRATLILFGVLLLLAAFVYFFEIKGKAVREKSDAKSKTLLVLDEDQIQKVTVIRPAETLVFEREGDRWRILEPVKTLGDKYAAKGLVTSAATAKSERVIDEAEGLAEYGLAVPKFTLIVRSKTGLSDTLLIGDPNPTGSSVFVKKPGKPAVHLTATALSSALGKSLFDLRDRTALPFEKEDVRKIEINRGAQTVLLEKENDSWEVKSPFVSKAAKTAVDGLLSKVGYAEVRKFETESPSGLERFGLLRPSVVLTLTGGPNQSQKRLLIGRRDGAVFYARDEARPPVFTVDSSLVNELNKEAADLRDRKVCDFDQWNVKRCEIRSKAAPLFICVKDTSDDWAVESPEKGKAKSWKITGMFSDLSGLEAVSFIGKTSSGLSRYGLDQPVREIVLKDGKDGIVASVAFGSASAKDEVFVLNRLSKWVYTVKAGILKNLTPDLKEVLEKAEPVKTAAGNPAPGRTDPEFKGNTAKKQKP